MNIQLNKRQIDTKRRIHILLRNGGAKIKERRGIVQTYQNFESHDKSQ